MHKDNSALTFLIYMPEPAGRFFNNGKIRHNDFKISFVLEYGNTPAIVTMHGSTVWSDAIIRSASFGPFR